MAGDPGRVVGRARGLAATAIRALRTRVELFGVEVQEERARVVRDLLIAVAALNLLMGGLLLAVAWIVLALPAELRGPVLGILALVVLICGAGALLWLRLEGARRKPFLGAIVAVLKDDERALGKDSP